MLKYKHKKYSENARAPTSFTFHLDLTSRSYERLSPQMFLTMFYDCSWYEICELKRSGYIHVYVYLFTLMTFDLDLRPWRSVKDKILLVESSSSQTAVLSRLRIHLHKLCAESFWNCGTVGQSFHTKSDTIQQNFLEQNQFDYSLWR